MEVAPRPTSYVRPLTAQDDLEAEALEGLAGQDPDSPAASARMRRVLKQRVALLEKRRRRALLVTIGLAAVLMASLMTASGSISTVYARESAPAVAQDNGLLPPPTDASGNLLPPTETPGTETPGAPSVSPFNTLQTNPPPQTSEATCATVYHSSDGNPYPICPGPQPVRGGNCTWWVWEQWHLLGYNLPAWGDATYWANRAAQYGLQEGTVPRVNAIAAFPRGDGVWAFSSAGHVAVVTKVYSDGDTFDVTYENYGDPTLVHYGRNYRVSVIQQPRYQDGQLRFIYFPGTGGGTGGTGTTAPTSQAQPDSMSNYTGDFTGDGHTEVLRYDRTLGTIDILQLSDDLSSVADIPVEDATTSNGKWGSAWEIYVGNFDADPSGRAGLLLYDRQHGIARFISFFSNLSVDQDVKQTGWKSTWEIYVGKFNGRNDQLLFYDRQTNLDKGQWTPEPGEPAVPAGVDTGSSNQNGNSNANPPPDANGSGNGSPYDPNSDDWEHHHRTATLALVDYTANFTVNHQQTFDRWHNTFEVHVGQFGQPGRDSLLFYDRKAGVMLVMGFDSNLKISQSYQQNKVSGNWEVYPGDYDGTMQDSVFLFDRTTNKAQMMAFNPDLTLRRQVTYTNWGSNWEFHIGHFGGPSSAAEGLLMYNRSAGSLAFVGFNANLGVASQSRYNGFRSDWTVLVGQFGAPCTNPLGGTDATSQTPTPSATPTNTPTPNPNNDGAPTSPTSGTTVTVNQTCTDSVLLVNQASGAARMLFFSFDNGLQNGKPDFTQTTVPWPTPTPTDTPTPRPTRPPSPAPTNPPGNSGTAPTPTPSPTSGPTPSPTPTDPPTPSPTPTDPPTPTPTP